MTFTAPQKISDVERLLAEIKARRGDIDVVVFAPDWRGCNDWRPVQLREGDLGGGVVVVKIEG